MWKIFLNFLCICAYIACKGSVDCASLNDTKTLLFDLLSDYNINVRPVADQEMSVNVSVQPYIKSIQEFDEVQGKFAFVGALAVIWHDVNMMWNPDLYGEIYEVTVLYPNVWIPDLVLSSPSDDVDTLGKKWHRIRYYNNGIAVWFPVDLIESTCSVNVRNYPFDTQKCVTSFNSFGYDEYEVQLIAASGEFNLEVYQENSIWEIEKTKVNVTEVGGGSQIDLIIYLSRKPSFVVISVVIPILFLSLLNVLVFLLIPESGERVSYCITVLLAVAVFMTIVSDMLPRSSEPVPVISFKLMADMVISSFIVLVTIINLKWYYTDNSVPVPQWLKSLYKGFSCNCCTHQKVNPGELVKNHHPGELVKNHHKGTVQTIDAGEIGHGHVVEKIKRVNDAKYEDKITWKQISRMVDWISLVCFTVSSLASFVIFFAITSANPDP